MRSDTIEIDTRTNIEVIKRFLDLEVRVERADDGVYEIQIRSTR